MKLQILSPLVIMLISLAACNPQSTNKISQQTTLASWNNTETKNAIISYVEDVTNKQSSNHIEIADRIAVFDNDGTLWPEKPFYFQLYYAIDKVKEKATDNPEWKNQEPFKSVLENNIENVLKQGEHALIELVLATHSNLSAEAFENEVVEWIQSSKHPEKDKLFTDLIYQPMLELIQYLKANDFTVFIVSGGGVDFIRAWSEEVYGIAKHEVIGSSLLSVYNSNAASINKLAKIDFIDDKEGKPVGIHKTIGRQPVFCAGNSDGDLAMMQYTAANKLKNFQLYVHHTDEKREWKYDRESNVGRFDKALDESIKNGWTLVDMANDWQIIYPFELDSE